MGNIIAEGESAALDGVEDFLQAAIDGVGAGSRFLLDAWNICLQASEDEHGVLATLLSNLNVGAIHSADDQATVHHKLHVGGATSLGAGGGDVLGDVGGRDDGLSRSHRVIGDEGNLEVRRDVGVVVDDLADVADQLDDGLGVLVGWGRLASDQASALLEFRSLGRRGLLEQEVAVDDVEAVQQLSLVLVDTLELAVEESVGIGVQDVVALQVGNQTLLGLALGGHPLLLHGRIVLLLLQGLQQVHVDEPLVGAQVFGVQVAQRPVGAVHPTAGGDSVGHVHELVLLALGQIVLVEVGESLLLHDLGVECSDAVDFVAAQHSDVAHPDAFEGLLLEQGETPDLGAIAVHLCELLHEALVDLAADVQVPWEQLLHHVDGPLLQSLRHDGVVGVVARLLRKLPGLVPGEPLNIYQEAHHLQDCHGGMGVVHLNGDLLGEFRPLSVGLLDELTQEILQGGANEEILLLQAQQLALILVVVGIKDSGQVLSLTTIVNSLRVAELVECLEVKLLGRKGPPKSQVVGVVGVEARDGIVIGHGLNNLSADPSSSPGSSLVAILLALAAKSDRIGHVRTRDLPRDRLGKPIVGLLDLPAVDDVLLEDAIAVSDAIAPARERQSGHGVQEAGGQSAETSVAETGVGFEGVELLEFEAKAGQSILEGRLQIQVNQSILERTAQQVLGRQVVGPLHVLLAVPVVGVVEAFQKPIADG
mmetsp:Transcript_93814/g.195689  ORF Transcript_93814/g.195689 Transcript_93814/m.195689 type:complete len:706 (-) Transcript_93814:403-2520(-)